MHLKLSICIFLNIFLLVKCNSNNYVAGQGSSNYRSIAKENFDSNSESNIEKKLSNKPYNNIAYTNNSHISRSYLPTSLLSKNNQQYRPDSKPNYVTPKANYVSTSTNEPNVDSNLLLSSNSPNLNYEYKCEYKKQPKLPQMSDSQKDYSIVGLIHKSSYQGYVLFTSLSSSGYEGHENLSVKVHITSSRTHGQPVKEAFSWRIYNQHSIDLNGQCALFLTSDDLLHDLTINFGPLIVGKQHTFGSEEFTNLILHNQSIGKQRKQGLSSLLGKTLMLIGAESGIKICTTLLPAGSKHVYEAKFHYPIAGRVKIVHANNQLQASLLTEYLMYSNGERKESKHKWQIVEALTNNDYNYEKVYADKYNYEKNNCANLKYNHILPLEEINELNNLIVNTEMPTLRGRSSHVISTIKPLNTYGSLYLVLFDSYEPHKILACAPINKLRPKVASAVFKYAPIFGSINFYQESPLDPTEFNINLNLTSPAAYFYGIDAIPSIKRKKPETKKCPNIKETIFNPNSLDSENIPFEGQGTTDQYAIGDLSGKFCSISYSAPSPNYKPGYNQPIKVLNLYGNDYNLPLFGKNSVVGRALVFYDLEGNAVSCANIDLLGGNMNTAYATFDQPIQGQFIFRQSANYCNDEVFVYVEISKPDSLNAYRTDNHGWHIHDYPVKTGFETLSTTQCDAAGGHFNPYNVSVDATYLRDCTSLTNERCERGDTTSKLSPISITPYKPITYIENGEKKAYSEPEVFKIYLVDSDLSLCGPNSIVGKSIVVHDKHFSSPRISCANILEFKTKN